MTIEEKAKAYDEALDRAIELYEKDSVFDSEKTLIRCIFPELAESEDERIRKEVIDFICWATDRGCITKEQREKSNSWLAWLEKKGEHHIACSEEQMKVLNEVLNFAANHESPYWNDYIFGTLSNLIRQLKKLKYKEV